MANTDPEVIKAAQLAYARSNASLTDYDPAALADEDKLGRDVVKDAPLEPVLTRADDTVLPAPVEAPAEKPSK